MDVRFVTSNPSKFREVRALLAPFGLRVRRLNRTLPEPQAERLEEVVRAKLAALPADRLPVVVEDAGLFIDSLHGFPGVYSAHFYRRWEFPFILELLRRRPRTAAFRAVAGVRTRRGVYLFSGACRGEIVRRPRGHLGFGFDPIFRPLGSRRTFAEMDVSEKNRFSHRARAFRKAARFLAGGRDGHPSRPRAPSAASKGTKRKRR